MAASFVASHGTGCAFLEIRNAPPGAIEARRA